MPYKVYFEIAGGKKLWINKEFNTKSDAEKELKIAEKEVRSAVQIIKSGIISTGSAVKPTVLPKSTKSKRSASKSVEVPTKGLIVLKFDKNGMNHLVGIAPAQFNIIKQAFTLIKCNYAHISLSPTKMQIAAIDKERVCVLKMTVPVRTGSGVEFCIDADHLKSVPTLPIVCFDDNYYESNPSKYLRVIPLSSCSKAQASAKDICNMVSPYSAGKYGRFNKVMFRISSQGKAIVVDSEMEPLSTSVALRKIGTGKEVTSYYQSRYIKAITKILGSTIMVVGMKENSFPMSISGINKGIKIEYICAPYVANNDH